MIVYLLDCNKEKCEAGMRKWKHPVVGEKRMGHFVVLMAKDESMFGGRGAS